MRPSEGVVRRRPPLAIVVVLEERRVDDPEEVPLAAVAALGDEAKLLGQVEAQVRHHRLHAGFAPELEEDEVPVFRLDRGR